jgi:hypothetical protein
MNNPPASLSNISHNTQFSRLLRTPRPARLRKLRRVASPAWLLALALCPTAKAKEMLPACPVPKAPLASQTIARAGIPALEEAAAAAASHPAQPSRQLIVIGFMGGNVRPNDFVHREAWMARDLEQRYPLRLHAAVFANSDGHAALETVLRLLDKDKDGCLSATEKSAARIVIYGHSWGASQTVTLAQRLNELDIPVLLTIQVDSVQKLNEHDGRIPPNVRQAINFYQSDGLLHGRSQILAMDPKQTTILGNFESAYKENPISCAGYPWYARAFMKPHIEIENDPSVWNKIEALIQTQLL